MDMREGDIGAERRPVVQDVGAGPQSESAEVSPDWRLLNEQERARAEAAETRAEQFRCASISSSILVASMYTHRTVISPIGASAASGRPSSATAANVAKRTNSAGGSPRVSAKASTRSYSRSKNRIVRRDRFPFAP